MANPNANVEAVFGVPSGAPMVLAWLLNYGPQTIDQLVARRVAVERKRGLRFLDRAPSSLLYVVGQLARSGFVEYDHGLIRLNPCNAEEATNLARRGRNNCW